jgi:hypothetical protein
MVQFVQYKTEIWLIGILVLSVKAYSNETNIGYLKSRPVLNLENIGAKQKLCSKAYLEYLCFLCCITFH